MACPPSLVVHCSRCHYCLRKCGLAWLPFGIFLSRKSRISVMYIHFSHLTYGEGRGKVESCGIERACRLLTAVWVGLGSR